MPTDHPPASCDASWPPRFRARRASTFAWRETSLNYRFTRIAASPDQPRQLTGPSHCRRQSKASSTSCNVFRVIRVSPTP